MVSKEVKKERKKGIDKARRTFKKLFHSDYMFETSCEKPIRIFNPLYVQYVEDMCMCYEHALKNLEKVVKEI